MESRQIAAQHERRRGLHAALLVVAFAPSHLAEPGAGIEPPRRRIVLVDLEKDRPRTETGEPSQMQREQRAGEPSTRRGAATATERISASSAASRDRMKPASMPPTTARCASTLRSSNSRSITLSLQP